MTTATQNDSLAIAKTILTQLGGNRFKVMTGATQFMAIDNGLRVKFPNRAAGMPNIVTVTLDPSDTYHVEFVRLRGSKATVSSTHDGIYADMLRDLFTSKTGLYTSF